MSPMLMERFEFPLNSSQIMGSSLFSACSHTDSRHGAMFPGMQTVTEAVTFFSIFTLRSKVMTIPYGARLYPRLAEAIGFCHSTILFPIIIHKMRRAERSWGGGGIQGMTCMIWFSGLYLYILQNALNQGLVIWLT